MATPKGLKVSINNTPQGTDDYESWGDDITGIQFINVLGNDLGGGSTTLVGFWTGPLPSNLGDLLNPGALATSFVGSGIGATISIENNQVKYDFGSNDYNYLAEGQSITDVFYYVLRMGNGAYAVAKVEVTITGENDGPVANVDVGEAIEAGVLAGVDATGNVLTNDEDVDDGATLTVTNIADGDEDLAVTAGTDSSNGTIITGVIWHADDRRRRLLHLRSE